jgi:hypothetical protein
MNYVFNTIEFVAFILPALPNDLWVRLTIVLTYFILHYFKAQHLYAHFKYEFINNEKNEELNYIDISV